MLLEARGEVDEPEGIGPVVEEGLEHVGVGDVALDPRGAGGRADLESASPGLVEQRAEDRLRVEAGKAAPDHGAVPVDERRILAIAYETEVVEAHRRPPRRRIAGIVTFHAT